MRVLMEGGKGLWRVYDTPAERVHDMIALVMGGGYNYFVLFRDVQGLALNADYADWVTPGAVYVDW
jgi:hypothetical protein